jgi:hypothetical protein
LYLHSCIILQANAGTAGTNKQRAAHALTPLWKGERFADGRPKVPDDILRRMKSVSVEEAWAVMKNEGYGYQVAEGWE